MLTRPRRRVITIWPPVSWRRPNRPRGPRGMRRSMLAVQTSATDIKWVQQESAHARTAQEKLANSPDDGDANHVIGRFLCLVRGDWNLGLPNMVKGSHPAFEAAATADLARPVTSEKQLAVGNLWWDLAEKESGAAQRAIRRRAGFWYSQCANDPQFMGLSRALVEKRLASIPPGGEMANALPSVLSPSSSISTDPGRSADLIFANGPAARGRMKVVLFVGNPKEQGLLAGVGAEVHAVTFADTAKVLADAHTYDQSTVIAWGRNTLSALPEGILTDAIWGKMHRFM